MAAIAPQETDFTQPAWWFVCEGSALWTCLDEKGAHTLPDRAQLAEQNLVTFPSKHYQFLGYLSGKPCFATPANSSDSLQDGEGHPWSVQKVNLRSLYGQLPDDLFSLAGRAVQLVEWDLTHQYCGRCATRLVQQLDERAKSCPNCQLRQYPKLSPAVIMLIHKGDKLLLARAPRFRSGMYSVLAGFVEPGESLEETVIREVREEVGIEIKNIRYFGSQPWPFPKSLMVGFIAEYASGEFVPDPIEIEAVDWFDKDSLPPVPGELSIARKLINWFVNQE